MRAVTGFILLQLAALAAMADREAILEKHCTECHDADEKKGRFDLTALQTDFEDAEIFARWVKPRN